MFYILCYSAAAAAACSIFLIKISTVYINMLTSFLQVMGFYLGLSYIIAPTAAYYLIGKDNVTVGNAWAGGSIVSLILWFTVGKSIV